MSDLTDAIEAAALAMYFDARSAQRNRDMAERAIAAAAPLIEAQVRAKVAEEVAADILARLAAIGLRPTPWADGYTLASQYAAAVSRKHAVRMPDVAQEATNTPDAYPSEGPAVSDAHRAAQTDDRQEQ